MRRLLAPALAAALLPLFTPASAGAAVVCGVTGSLLDTTGQAVPGANLAFMNDNGYGSATTGSAASTADCSTRLTVQPPKPAPVRREP